MSRFLRQVVVDDQGKPLPGAIGQVYSIDDTAHTTPLSLFAPSGSPIPLNQLVANGDGVTPPFSTPNNPRVVWVSGAYETDMLAWDVIPTGGTVNQVLKKLSGADLDFDWEDAGGGIAQGGTTGQFLVKQSSADYATQWIDGVTNVKSFGAIGDGTADDKVAIQAALDTGGSIYFPPGDYRVSGTLKITKDGTKIWGAGAGNRNGATQPAICTRIRGMTGLTGSLLLVQRVADDRPLADIQISDMAFDGNVIAGPVDGIIFRASQSIITNCAIWAFSGVGLRVRGYAVPYWDTYDTRFHNLLIGQCTTAGVFLDNNSSDLHFSHCVFLNNFDNFVVSGGASHQITGCHFYGASRYNVFFNGSGSRTKFANCKIEAAAQHGVYIDSTLGGYADIQFTGCGFSQVDEASADNTWDLVHLTGPTSAAITRTTFVGNNFNLKGGSTKKNRFAINLASSAMQGTVITGNSFGTASHWGTAPLNNGTNSTVLGFIKGNAGLPDIISPVVKTASYTADPIDTLGVIEMNSATAVTVTIPPNAQPGFQKGNVLTYTQTGAGQVTFVGGSGVTLRTPRSLTTRAQWSTVTLRLNGTNTWVLSGDLT